MSEPRTTQEEYPLENLEKLARLMHNVERVKRVARRPDEQEWTNTAEHTFELAMMCWYIVTLHKLDFNMEKVFKYALAHDIVEVYAGDTPVFDDEALKTKHEREAAALERLEKEFPEFSDFTALIHEYEARETPEARFVYATDKLLDPLNSSMETTQSIWKDVNMSLEKVVEVKRGKVTLHDVIAAYWVKLLAKIEARKEFFFHS